MDGEGLIFDTRSGQKHAERFRVQCCAAFALRSEEVGQIASLVVGELKILAASAEQPDNSKRGRVWERRSSAH
jgi:hypothetical protein